MIRVNGKIRIFFTGVIACFSFLLADAQPVIKTFVDKNEILIGDQFKLTVEAGFPSEEYNVKWVNIPDSLAHFEVVSRGKIDSTYSDTRLSKLAQTFTLTSFDSGKWLFPPFAINMMPVNAGTTYNFFTDSVPVTVSFSTSDTTSQLRDIKPIMEVEQVNRTWYWVAAAAIVIALLVFLFWLYKKGKKKTIPVTRLKTNVSPYDEAMKALEEVRSHTLTDPRQVKLVHIKLAEILKRYLSRKENDNFENKTTGEILIALRDQNRDADTLAKAAASLRCSDAVKFAKYMPPQTESENCLQLIREVIHAIHQKP